MFDFLEEHRKDLKKQKPEQVFDPITQKTKTIYLNNYLTVILDEYRGVAILKYPPRPMEQFLHEEGEELERFEQVLLARDFPCRNTVLCYGKDDDVKDIVIGWLVGEDPSSGPSLERFLKSGKKRYIPDYTTRSADASNEVVAKLLTHGKYHFGSSVNV